MKEKIEKEIEKLTETLDKNIGEQEKYAIRYTILILQNLLDE